MCVLKEKMSAFLKKNDLKYFMSNEEDEVFRILLPYRFKNYKQITLFIDAYSELNLLKLGFHEVLSNDNIENIKTKLLDKNGKLVLGTLSLEKDSNIVTFSIDWIIGQTDDISTDIYNKNILYALNVYDDLIKENIIANSEGI